MRNNAGRAKRVLKALPFLPVLLIVMPVGGATAEPATVTVFDGTNLYFSQDSAGKFDTPAVTAEDNGRESMTTVTLPPYQGPVRITAHLALHPIPVDEQTVADKWDRAGDIRLVQADGPDIEVVKFVTSYGGETAYDVDVSQLAPLLQGKCTFRAFIDTWVNPAWTLDFSLTFEPDTEATDISWVWARGIYFEPSYDTRHVDDTGMTVTVNVPDGFDRVLLYYLVSGHCTDGRDADEFVQKDNVISVDDVVVYRFRPWRDDCRQFRDINPYCRRWSDGYWSSDYSRSGWCPGDVVLPIELDLTDHLTPGKHTVRFVVENVRPVDGAGNYGYWRLSSYLIGWKRNGE